MSTEFTSPASDLISENFSIDLRKEVYKAAKLIEVD